MILLDAFSPKCRAISRLPIFPLAEAMKARISSFVGARRASGDFGVRRGCWAALAERECRDMVFLVAQGDGVAKAAYKNR